MVYCSPFAVLCSLASRALLSGSPEHQDAPAPAFPGLCEQQILTLPAPAPTVTLVPRWGSGPKAPPCPANKGPWQPRGSQQNAPNLRGVTFKNLSPQTPGAELKQGRDHGKCQLASFHLRLIV